MRELELKYGCNPSQTPASVYAEKGELPFKVRNGRPGYINFLDALSGWQLVRELSSFSGLPAAASFKHVSPAGAALGLQLNDSDRKAFFADDLGDISDLASAYVRARGADRMSSFGDFAALSHVCDADTARVLRREVSDGVIAPGYDEGALAILREKKNGNYAVIEIDPDYEPPAVETRQVFGVTFSQGRNDVKLDRSALENIVTENKELTDEAVRDLVTALITTKYTQSNSVCCAVDGQAIGTGAGQQSRIHCVRLAAGKADLWKLRRHPKVLDLPFLKETGRPVRDNVIDAYISGRYDEIMSGDRWRDYFSVCPDPLTEEEKNEAAEMTGGIALASDAFFPFQDNIERAAASGVKYIAEPGGSLRDEEVIRSCDRYGMVMAFTGIRLFHH